MAPAAEIKVMLGAAFKPALLELAPEFERTTGYRLAPIWLPGVQMLDRLKSGEAVDLVITTGGSVDNLIRLGELVSGSRVDIVRSIIGAAVRTGTARPDISSGDALRRTLLAAKSIVCSTGPSGVYMLDLFGRMGITDALKPKLVSVEDEPAGAPVMRGEAELCFQQMSELMPVPGIDIVGPLSADVQCITVFASGLHVRAQHPDAARALVKLATSPGAASAIRKSGLEPA
jgi:molybdate transport system substrate-binding protein